MGAFNPADLAGCPQRHFAGAIGLLQIKDVKSLALLRTRDNQLKQVISGHKANVRF
jgi:hypothetical protein